MYNEVAMKYRYLKTLSEVSNYNKEKEIKSLEKSV